MGFLELDYRGVVFLGNSEVKLEQVPESHEGLLKQESLVPTPHFLIQEARCKV